MSWKASNVVAELSEADGNARLLLYSLAEIAHTDGVAWANVDYDEADPEWKKRRSLRWRMGKPDEKTVRLAIDRAQLLDELEVLIAFDGRRRFHIYRILVGSLRDAPVDYSRGLPRLAGQFWTPDELLLAKEERPIAGHRLPWTRAATGGQITRSSDGECDSRRVGESPADDRENHPSTGGQITHPHTSKDRSGDPPLTSSETSSDEVPAGAGGKLGDSLADQLLRAFAEEIGAWPNDRREWGAWKRAFKELAESEEPSVDELRISTREYVKKIPSDRRDLSAIAFGMTAAFEHVRATLLNGYFRYHRWITETAWRLEPEQVAEILAGARRITDAERDELRALLHRTRAAHADPASELLRWVEIEGWAVDDDVWRAAMRERGLAVGKPGADDSLARIARDLRLELRGARADLQLGIRSDVA